MRNWQWSAEDAWSLGLAADVRFGPTDYVEDQIWELQVRTAEPVGLAAVSCFGGRVRGMCIFPSFGLEGRAAVDPGTFHRPITVEQALPNYARLSFWPLIEVEAVVEYWVVDSQRLASRIRLAARSEHSLALDLRLHVATLPGSDADPMRPVTRLGAVALEGRVAELRPVVFLSGGATPFRSIFPSLHASATFAPGEVRSWTWVHAGMPDPERGFEAARQASQQPLDAIAARIERMAEGIVQVETGHPDWDAAVHLSQVAALSSFVGPTRHLPASAPVLRRGPLDGHSPRGDGTDHDWRWSGQEMPAACFLARQVLPAAPELAQGVVRNALATQGVDGAVDGKPGLAGQRLRMAASPMLAQLTWQLFQQTEDTGFVGEVLPQLTEVFESWFDAAHDRDQDGFPEWDQPCQPGYEGHPVFGQTSASSQCADLQWVESPDLAALLVREAEALTRLGQAVGRTQDVQAIQSRRRRLLEAISRCWDAEMGIYRRIDRSLHTTPESCEIASLSGSGRIEAGASLPRPARLVVRVTGRESEARRLEVVLTGRPGAGRERSLHLTAGDMRWYWETGCATTPEAFATLSRIQVRGVADGVQTSIRVPDIGRADLAMLLPLWAEAPASGAATAMLDDQLLHPGRFWRPHGLPLLAADDTEYQALLAEGSVGVAMLWNAALGEALLAYGRGEQAGVLLERLMTAVVQSFRAEHALCQIYDPETGQGRGDRHAACGGVPLSLVLACVGVQLISPTKVGLRGRNVLAGPATVAWRGLQVTRNGEVSRIVFPDGQSVELQGEEPLVIEQQPRRTVATRSG